MEGKEIIKEKLDWINLKFSITENPEILVDLFSIVDHQQ